jgi:hypothetical protein
MQHRHAFSDSTLEKESGFTTFPSGYFGQQLTDSGEKQWQKS